MYLGYQNNKIKFYSEKPLNQTIYNLDKVEETSEDYVLVNDEYVLKTDKKCLFQLKQEKIKENDLKRDEALNQGVVYKNVLFDSDTDQKINLLAIVSTMPDTVIGSDNEAISTKTIWFGKNNQPLECTRIDLVSIGELITQLHTFCWTKNAQIKEAIENARTVKEVEGIKIEYNEAEEVK